jgi:8-oxo-dGTP pyrophosphatase MutT (NUDIX family)
MGRTLRCQGVILKNNCILVLKQFNFNRNQEYWMLPGGGIEEGESALEGALREIMEETNLEVEYKGILFEQPGFREEEYHRYVTFLFEPSEGSVEKVGKETVAHRKILELVWCSIIDESEWNEYLMVEQFYPSMRDIKNKLLSMNEICRD